MPTPARSETEATSTPQPGTPQPGTPQPGILAPPPLSAHFVTFALGAGADVPRALDRLARAPFDSATVVGVGAPLAAAAGVRLEGLRAFPALTPFPSTQAALWLALLHPDRGAAFDAGRAFAALLGDGFSIVEEIDAFVYRGGRDLSGFEDGTENPKGEAAIAAAIVAGAGAGLAGGSYVAVQRWVHDLDAAEAMSAGARDAVVGRERESNEEIETAPPSAHVKRTAQESFEPPAFVVRRSMPYGGVAEHGLYFIAYGESLDRFERQLRRMAGRDDGIVDGLLSFTRAVTGSYFFCPPVRAGRLDLRALGF
jgi:putative iron-dependent peroxidase